MSYTQPNMSYPIPPNPEDIAYRTAAHGSILAECLDAGVDLIRIVQSRFLSNPFAASLEEIAKAAEIHERTTRAIRRTVILEQRLLAGALSQPLPNTTPKSAPAPGPQDEAEDPAPRNIDLIDRLDPLDFPEDAWPEDPASGDHGSEAADGEPDDIDPQTNDPLEAIAADLAAARTAATAAPTPATPKSNPPPPQPSPTGPPEAAAPDAPPTPHPANPAARQLETNTDSALALALARLPTPPRKPNLPITPKNRNRPTPVTRRKRPNPH